MPTQPQDPYASIFSEPPPDAGADPFSQLDTEFKQTYGRPLRFTGRDTKTHIRLHGAGRARDIGIRELSGDELKFILKRGPELGLNLRDYSKAKPFTTSTGVRITGPHVHVDRDKKASRNSADPYAAIFNEPDVSRETPAADPYASIFADLGQESAGKPVATTQAPASPAIPSATPRVATPAQPSPGALETPTLTTDDLRSVRGLGEDPATGGTGIIAPKDRIENVQAQAARTIEQMLNEREPVGPPLEMTELRLPKGIGTERLSSEGGVPKLSVSRKGQPPATERIPAEAGRTGVQVNLSDYLKSGKAPTPRELGQLSYRGLGFEDKEAEEFTREMSGKADVTPDEVARTFYESGGAGSEKQMLERARGDEMNRVIIPDLAPEASEQKRQWLKTYREKKEWGEYLESLKAIRPEYRAEEAKEIARTRELAPEEKEILLGKGGGLVGKGIATLAEGASSLVGNAMTYAGELLASVPSIPGLTSEGSRKMGRDISGAGSELTKRAEVTGRVAGLEPGIPRDVVRGVGSSLPFFALGAAGAAGRIGVGVLGWASNAGQIYEEAKASGLSHDKALMAAHVGGPAGLLEMWGIGGTLDRLGRRVLIGTFIRTTLREAGEEATQEAVQQALNNLTAKGFYDSKRGVFKDVGYSALIAGITGGLIGGGSHAVASTAEKASKVTGGKPAVSQRRGINLLEAEPGRPSGRPGIQPKEEPTSAIEDRAGLETKERPQVAAIPEAKGAPAMPDRSKAEAYKQSLRDQKTEQDRQLRELGYEPADVTPKQARRIIADEQTRFAEAEVEAERMAVEARKKIAERPARGEGKEPTIVERAAIQTRLDQLNAKDDGEFATVMKEIDAARLRGDESAVAKRYETFDGLQAEEARLKARLAKSPTEAKPTKEGEVVAQEPARVPGVAGVVKRAREGERRAQVEGAVDQQTQLQNKGQWLKAQPHAEADPNREIAVIDLNNLKQANDTYGHAVGDRYIEAAATAVREEAKKAGIPERDLFRTGGDELHIIGNKGKLAPVVKAIKARVAEFKHEDFMGGAAAGIAPTTVRADALAYADKKAMKRYAMKPEHRVEVRKFREASAEAEQTAARARLANVEVQKVKAPVREGQAEARGKAQPQAGAVAPKVAERPEEGLTPEGAGISNEELARGGTFYKVSRSGALTYMGKQADATLRPGEATVYRKADGTLETYAGEPSLVGKYGARITEAASRKVPGETKAAVAKIIVAAYETQGSFKAPDAQVQAARTQYKSVRLNWEKAVEETETKLRILRANIEETVEHQESKRSEAVAEQKKNGTTPKATRLFTSADSLRQEADRLLASYRETDAFGQIAKEKSQQRTTRTEAKPVAPASFAEALLNRLNEKRQSKAEQLKQRIREQRGAPKLYQRTEDATQPADGAKQEPWQMTRAEFRRGEGEARYTAIVGAIKTGRPIQVRTQYRITPIKTVEHIRLARSGEIQTREGRGWVTLTEDQANSLAAQAGVKIPSFMERVTHGEHVEEAVRQGKPVSASVLAEYPDLAPTPKPGMLFQQEGPRSYDEINLPEDIKRPLLEIAQSFLAEGNTDYAKLVSNFETLLGGDFEYVIDALPAIVQHAENLERLRTAPSDKIDLAPGEATEKAVATGKTSRAVTSRGTEVRTRFALFESDQPITSHDIELRPNPHFPEGVQNRDRAKVSSEDDLNEKIKRFEPEYLGRSIEAGRGAPIIGPDMAVESGNGRVIMLRRIYRDHPVQAAKYKTWLKDNAARFGMTSAQVEAMNQPVLAQIRITELSPAERIQFAEQANEDTQLKLSPVEVARGDARKLSAGLIAQFKPGTDGDILAASNREFVKGFLDQVVGPSRGDVLTSTGELNQNGADRIRNAIFARAYADTDAGVQALEKLSEETDVNTRRVITAMVSVAPRFVELKQMITGGGRYALDLSPDLAEAARQLSLVRESGVTVDEFLRQGQLFGENLSRVQKKLLWTLNENARSATKLGQVLTNYLDAVDAIGDPRQKSFFNENVPTKEEILEAAVRRLSDADQSNIATAAQQAIGGAREGLFAERLAAATGAEATPADSRKSAAPAAKETAAQPAKPVVPTDRSSFKKALIEQWGYSPEVAHRTAEVMEGFAMSYAADLKAADPKADIAQAKKAFYQAVQIGTGQTTTHVLEQAGKTLIAVHNTTQQGILEAAKLGGIPVPSIAVTRPEMKFTAHGDVTLIGNQPMIDPQADARNKVYAADIYSGRQPRPSHPFKPRTLNAFSARIVKTGAVKDITNFDSYYDVASQIRDVKYGAEDIKLDVYREFSRNMVVQLAFLRESGETVKVPQQAEKNYRGSQADLGKLRDILDKRITAKQVEFDAWLEKNTAPAFGEAYLQAGRKRVPYTLDNVLAAMVRPPRGREEGMTHSLGKARATAAKPFKSVEAMHKAEGTLAMPDDIKAFAEETQKRFFEFQSQIADRYKYPAAFQFDKLDDLSKALGDYLKGPKGRDNFEHALRRHDYDPSNIFSETIDEGIAIAKRLRDTPTQYFEAKPQRAVGLGEFSGAIVPSDAGPEVLKALRDAGIVDIRTYKAGDREAQAARAAEFENVLFQTARGATEFTRTGEAIIAALNNPNESTGVHEIAHSVAPIFFRLASQENAPASLKTAMRTMENFMGLADGEFLKLHEGWTANTLSAEDAKRYRDGQEKNARGFEAYLREGVAPTKALRAAFEKFKEWLTAIYRRLKDSPLDVGLNYEMVKAWDRLLGGEREAAALKISEDDHWNFKRSSFASPEVEARFRDIVRNAVIQSGGEHKVRVSREQHLERVTELSPDLVAEVKRLRESMIASREIFTAASQYAQTLTNQAQQLRTQITPATMPDEALALEDKIAALEHDATEIMSNTIGVRSEFGRNLALLAAQKTDQLSPERVLAVGKAMAKASGMAEDSRTWKTAARKLVGLSNETQSAQAEKKRIQKRKKGVEDGSIRPPGEKAKREPWQSVMLGHLKAQAKEASARLQSLYGQKLYQLGSLTTEELDRVRAKFESLKKSAAGRPIKTVVDDYIRQGGLFGAELSPAQQGALMEMASPTRRAPLSVEQGALFETSPTLESRREQSQLDKAGPSNLLFQRNEQTDSPEFKRWFGDSKVVDEKGEPLVVYHGTRAEFDEFRTGEHGGIFLTSDPSDAGDFAESYGGTHRGNATILPAFVRLENPDIVDYKGELYDPETVGALVATAKKAGHDGVILKRIENFEGSDLSTSYVAFEPTQIKSAIGNRGTFDPSNPNILFQQETNLPALAHDIATILAARVAEESQTKKGLPLDRILGEMRGAFPDVIGQYEEQIKATADGLLKDARRQALVAAARDPETQVSARRQLALDVADSKKLERQTQEAADQKRRQVDRIWEREAEKTGKEALAAYDRSTREWYKVQEEQVAGQMLADLQAEQAFRQQEQRRQVEQQIAAEKLSAEEAQKRLAEIDTAQARERQQIDADLKAEASAQKQFEKDQRAAVLEEAKKVSRAVLEAEHARLQDVADEARAQMKADREAAREAQKDRDADARDRREAEREQAARERRWDYPIVRAASEARERIAQAGYSSTVDDLAAIAAGMRLEEGRAVSPGRDLLNEFGDFYRKNATAIRERAVALLNDAKSGVVQRRLETKAAGRAEGVTKPREQAQAREDYAQWQAEELSRLAAEEAWQDKRIRNGKRDIAREFAKLNKLPWWEYAADIVSLPISLGTSIDLPHFRQGMMTLLNHPKVWVESLVKSASTWTEGQMDTMLNDLERQPLSELAQMSGLKQSGLETRRNPLSNLAREEFFQNRIARLFPHVRVSERQYTTAMDTMRDRIFALHAQPLLEKFPPALHPEVYSEIARITNIMTGVGDLGRFTKYTPLLNRFILFATRYMVGRAQLLGMLRSPLFYRGQPWEVRRIAAKEAYGYFGKMALLFALAHVLGITSFDLDDDDFLKLRIPKTNQKWDITGGVGGYVKTIGKVIRSGYRKATGQREFAGDSMGDTLQQFARSKLAPAASTLWDWKTGKTFTGEPFTWTQRGIDSVSPMITKDVYDAIKTDGARGLVMLPFAILGGNVSSYRSRKMPDRTGSQAERYATGFLREKMGSTSETAEEYKRRTLITELTAAKKAGKPTDRIEAALAKNGGPLTRKEEESFTARFGETPLQHAYPHLSEEEKQQVLKVATPTERTSVEPKAEKMSARLNTLFQSAEYKGMKPADQAEAMKRVAQSTRKAKTDAEAELLIEKDTIHDRLVEAVKSRPEFRALGKEERDVVMQKLGQSFRMFSIPEKLPPAVRERRAEQARKMLKALESRGVFEKAVDRLLVGIKKKAA